MDNRSFFILSLGLVMILTGAGCTTVNPSSTLQNYSTSTIESMDLTAGTPSKESLLTVYDATRALLNDATPERYLNAIDITGAGVDTPTMITKNWASRKQPLDSEVASLFLPDIDLKAPKTKFVTFAMEGDWAAYYFLVEDPHPSTEILDAIFGVQRFHKANGSWNVAMRSYFSVSRGYYDTYDPTVLKNLFLDSGISPVKEMGVDPTKN